MLYGNRFLTEDAPDREFPASGMSALDAMRLVDEELVLEGDPWRNLATFVTTWMEPEANRIIAENLYRKGTGWKAKVLASSLLEDAGVAIIGGPDFGILGEGYVRLSYANSTANILKALDRMGEFLTSRKAA